MHPHTLTVTAASAMVGALLLTALPATAGALGSSGPVGSSGSVGSTAPASCPSSPLAPPMRHLSDPGIDTSALELAQSPAVTDAKQHLLSTLEQSGLATDDAAADTMAAYVDSLALAKATDVANLGRVSLAWDQRPDRRWGLDNPDVIYRSVTVADEGTYEIRGVRNSSQNIYFQVTDVYTGDGTLGTTTGVLAGGELDTAEDGSFTLTLSSEPAEPAEPAEPGQNHLQFEPGSRFLVVRDALSDWATQSAAELSITQVGGPTVPDPEDPAAEVARRLTLQGEFWAGYTKDLLDVVPVNAFTPPTPASGGLPGQVNSFAQFDIDPDQALVVTVDPADAPYLGMQLGNTWFTSLDYSDRQSSLNNTQVATNPDGSVTYVVSQHDPQVCNWVDPVGHTRGLAFLRWQDLPAGTVPGPVHTEIVSIDEFADGFATLPRIGPGQRQAQADHRAASVNRRG